MVTFCTSTRKPLVAMPQQFWEIPLSGEMRLFAPPRSRYAVGAADADHVRAGAVVARHGPGHDPSPTRARHPGRSPRSLNILTMSPSLMPRASASFGIDPDGLVHVAVPALDLAGDDLPGPGDVVVLRVGAPAAVVAHEQQGILLGPLAADALVVEVAASRSTWAAAPARCRRESVGQPLRVELQLAARGLEGVLLGIFVELAEARRHLLPLRVGGHDAVLLVARSRPS